ncbi:chaperonin 10-like protein [Favolaschia claudopus]|uniref:Chaperonin 10-like protein n=1 Tax=Favolaschia claudopus TaxID=2862362 RepID=A0AAW0A3L5_9AGAR
MQTVSNKLAERIGDVPTVVSAKYQPRSDGGKMKVLAWFGTRDVRLIEAAIPDIPDPSNVMLRVTGTTIRGSDLHLYHGEIIQLQQGDILGHEFMGIIDRIGPDQKLSSMCDRTNSSGRFTGGFPGVQAEYVRVPKGNVNLLPIPDSVPDDKGLGPTGQCCVRFALLKGAKGVIGIDNVPARLKLAQEISGIEIINFEEHTVKRIQELVLGGLDVAIDCGTFHQPKTLLHKVEKALMLETDVSEIVNEMIMATRKMGSCAGMAAYAGYTNHFNIGTLMEKGIRLVGCGQVPVHKYQAELLEMIVERKLDPTSILTHRVSIDEFPALYASFDKRLGGVEKVFVKTKFSAPPSTGAPKSKFCG